MKKLFIVFTLLLTACVSALKPDPSIPAIQAGYPSAQFLLNNQIYHGLGMISVSYGSSLSDLALVVQTFASGTIRIDSRDCEISVSKSYRDFEQVRVPLNGAAVKNCLITVTVSPVYNTSSPIQVFGLRGHFAIRVIEPGESWVGSTHKVTENFSKDLVYNVGGHGRVRAVFSGCGIDFDDNLELDDQGLLHLNLARLVNVPRGTICVLEGVIISPEYQDLLVNEVVAKYDSQFTPLAIPAISMSQSTLRVEADNTVSIVRVDGAHKYSSSFVVRNFDREKRHVIEAVTVRGRSVVCVYQGGWLCQQ